MNLSTYLKTIHLSSHFLKIPLTTIQSEIDDYSSLIDSKLSFLDNSYFTDHSSYLAYHDSDVTEHSSDVTEHGSYLTYHYSYLIWKTHIFSKYPLKYSYLTYHTSYLPNIPHQKCHILLNYLFEMFILYLPPFISF